MKSIKSYIIIIIFMLCVIQPVIANTNSWDKNTLSFHHFDSINTIQSYNQTHGSFPFNKYVRSSTNYFNKNTTLDEVGLNWYAGGDCMYLSTNAKFGNYSYGPEGCQIYTDLMDQYMYNSTPTPYISEFDFKTTANNNWTVEGWINMPVSATSNRTIVSWLGNGTTTGDKNGTDSYKYNGTNIFLDRFGFISVSVGNTDKQVILNSSKKLTTGSYQHIAIIKNGTNLQIYNNGRWNGTLAIATTYNWSAGYYNFNLAGYGGKPAYRLVTIDSPPNSGVIDEIRISNVSRYATNFTPQTVEFVNPNNATKMNVSILAPRSSKFNGVSTLPLDSNTYAYGDLIHYSLDITNITDTKGIFIPVVNVITPFFDDTLLTPVYSVNNTGVNSVNGKAWRFVTDANELEVVPSESYIPYLPINEVYLEEDMYLDDEEHFKRFYMYINTSSNKTITTPVSIVDLWAMSGNMNYYFGFDTFTSDLPTTIYPDDINFIPAYPTTFEFTNGGLNTLKFMRNTTPDATFIDYTDYYGNSTIITAPEVSEVNVGKTFNVTVLSYDIFNINSISYALLYNKSALRFNKVYKITNESGLSSNNTMYNSAFPLIGSINTSFVSNYRTPYDIKSWITAGTEQQYAYYNMANYSFTVIDGTSSYQSIEMGGYDPSIFDVPYYNVLISPFSSKYVQFANSDSIAVDITDDYFDFNIRLIDINTNDPIDGSATVTYDIREAIPTSPQNVVGGILPVYGKGGSFNVTVAADGYYTTTQSFIKGSSGNIDVILTPLGGPNTQTWYSPHQVVFKIVDKNGLYLPNTYINVSVIESSLPGGISGARSTLIGVYGINPAEASKMVDNAIYMRGYTGDDGRIAFTMHGSLKYNITITDNNGNQYIKSLYPLDTYYILRTTSADNVIPIYVNNTYSEISNSTLTFSEPTISTMKMGIDYYDSSGKTDYIQFFIKLKNNNTVMYNVNQSVSGPQRVLINNTYNNSRGQQWIWWYDAHRTV